MVRASRVREGRRVCDTAWSPTAPTPEEDQNKPQQDLIRTPLRSPLYAELPPLFRASFLCIFFARCHWVVQKGPEKPHIRSIMPKAGDTDPTANKTNTQHLEKSQCGNSSSFKTSTANTTFEITKGPVRGQMEHFNMESSKASQFLSEPRACADVPEEKTHQTQQ